MLSAQVNWRIALFLSVLTFMVVAPALASAQIPTIVPANCRGDNSAANCSVCDIGRTAQNVLNAGVYISIFLSAVALAYAGWKYVTAAGGGDVSAAKHILWYAVLGLVLILAAWLIVDTIMKVMFDEGKGFGPWNEICGPNVVHI